MPRLALVTAIAAAGLDDDLAPLLDACATVGIDAQARAWDDPSVAWGRFDAVLLRSPWDYAERLHDFLDWCGRVASRTRLLNPLPVIGWNTDKHYLADLAARGVAIVPSTFVEPAQASLPALQAFLAAHQDAEEFVVKPAVGAGSRDAQRYGRTQEFAAAYHLARLLEAERSALLQPYLPAVDRDGETALIHFDGEFSHAIRKGPLLRREDAAPAGPFVPQEIAARMPSSDELALAAHALAAAGEALRMRSPLPYARVDLIPADDGQPRLLELELCEPSLFFAHAPGSAERFAAVLARLLASR